jgi:hypothetical protein
MKRILEKINKAPLGRKRLYYSLRASSCIILIAAILFAFYVGRAYYIKHFGINLVPKKDYPVQVSSYYRQNDPKWKDIEIGASKRKMGSTGCLISCVATAISELSSSVTPEGFNTKLTEVDGFQGADLIWYKINEAYPDINYRYSRIFSNKTIESDLEKGLLPIVNVRYKKTGVTHWVLIVGAKDGEFIICDPLDDGFSSRLLSEHGKVYAYRVIY